MFLISELVQLTRFGIVGIIATLVHLLAAAVILSWLDNSVFVANTLAFLMAFNVSFFGHRYITFGAAGRLSRFVVTALFGFFVNNVILVTVVAGGVLSGWWSIFIATVCMPAVTYLLMRFWVFSRC